VGAVRTRRQTLSRVPHHHREDAQRAHLPHALGGAGVLAPVAVSVRFEHAPTYNTYGLAAQDYPRVWAERGLPSPHRMPTDDSLCLFFPHDPPERRWHSALGLLTLLDLARDHLFFEHHWRTTGGWSGGEWLGAQAPHGFPGSNTR
jgi:hypothetical protein